MEFVEQKQWDWDGKKQAKEANELHNFEERVKNPPVRGTRSLTDIYQRYNVAVFEPVEYAEAERDKKRIVAMQEELTMIEKNDTWKLVERPLDRTVIGVKWVYRTKLNADGSTNKHKARLVVKGYAQIFCVDFSETLAPIARLDTIRLLLGIAGQRGWKIYQLDVKSVFLNVSCRKKSLLSSLQHSLKDLLQKDKKIKVYLLKKALYELKQAPRVWYSRIDDHLSDRFSKKSKCFNSLHKVF